jgi:hypothetical protein
MMKPLAVALSGVGEGLEGSGGGNLTNIQCQAIRSCHNESSLSHEYVLIKMKTYIKYINHIHPPLTSPFTLPLSLVLSPYKTCFAFLSFIIKLSVFYTRK